MAWSWSHTVEGMENVRKNIMAKGREWLEVVYAEWHASVHVEDEPDGFNQHDYQRALQHAKTLPDDVLAEYVCERTEEYATCSNGGHEAYCCPYDCGCHSVAFDLEDA
jgi:hypothetical protein